MFRKFSRDGEIMIWLTAGALGTSLLMLIGLLLLIVVNAVGGFWPGEVALITKQSGEQVFGEILDREAIPDSPLEAYRVKIKRANRDLYGEDFVWLDESEIQSIGHPENIAVIQRSEWGDFIGTLKSLQLADGEEISDKAILFDRFQAEVEKAREVRSELEHLAKGEIGRVSYQQEKIRLKRGKLERAGDRAAVVDLEKQNAALQAEFKALNDRLIKIRNGMSSSATFADAAGTTKDISLLGVMRAWQPNAMSRFDKSLMYIGNVWRFLWEAPREANTEGGVAPAIFGTVMMVFLMSIIVTPLGVLAAIYLHEYAKPGPMVALVRIAVNNLAGVPSIVFGVFGVGFFIYFVGGSIDEFFFSESLPAPTYGTGGILWASLTLALLTVPTVIVAAEEGLSTIPRHWREASYALGATKFETTWKVVLPALTPSILTGVILAIARAAGEVAPLMITGVVKLAPALPMDGYFPFVHLDRKFMHLGFHIYDLGFQSPNVDAARPTVFATTLLLIVLVIALNSVAILARNRLRRRFVSGAI